jgi:catechol 2,3-dioxygenase-like lactoylglutathione lyase family enzyme
MAARLNHIAIVSQDCQRGSEFYKTLFGMKGGESKTTKTADPKLRAVELSDGYVGINFNGRKPGYRGELHHFGFEVDDIDAVYTRIRARYPSIKASKRPSNRPFAALTTHDPEGNFFDLSHKNWELRRGIYAEEGWEQARRVHHIKLRVIDAAKVANFYKEVLQLEEEDKALEDPNFYLTDGRMTLIVAPWDIDDFTGAGIDGPGLEHVGFKVESIDAVQREAESFRKSNSESAGMTVPQGIGGEIRLGIIASCRYGQCQLADPDGIFVDLSQ